MECCFQKQNLTKVLNTIKTTKKDSTKTKNHVKRENKGFNKTWLAKIKTKLRLNLGDESNS